MGSRGPRTPSPYERLSCLLRRFPIARAQALSGASRSFDGVATNFGAVRLGAGSSKSDVFRGVNARRRSVHGQDKHLNERCSYPGALIAFAGTTCTKCIIAPHTIQRMETTRLNARTSSSVEVFIMSSRCEGMFEMCDRGATTTAREPSSHRRPGLLRAHRDQPRRRRAPRTVKNSRRFIRSPRRRARARASEFRDQASWRS
jgi:hypothetical protein